MKKKIIAIGLITTMIICNSMTVWAADTWGGAYDEGGTGYVKGTGDDSATTNLGDTGTKNVTSTFAITSAEDTISVNISWGSLAFSPQGELNGVWSADDGYYTIADGQHTGWIVAGEGADEITVTNNSDVNVATIFSHTIDDTFKNNYFIDPDASNPSLSFTTDSNLVYSRNNFTEEITTNEFINKVSVNAIITKAPDTNSNTVTLGTVTIYLFEEEE